MKVARTDDIETCRHLRRLVFMDEQGISEADEFDDRDGDATHFLLFTDDQAVGTARAFVIGEALKIGRVCVLKETRGTGAGQVLMRGVMAWGKAQGLSRAKLDAQTYIVPFYERLGFAASGPEFDDAGIPHRYMEAPL